MKVLVLLAIILIVSPESRADFIVSPGISVTTAHNSEETTPAGKEVVTFKSSLGMSIDSEWRFFRDSISISAGAIWRGSEAVSQYSYTNPYNPLDTATVADLKTNSSSLSGFIGPRFRFLNLKYFKIFAGAGLNPGILYLNFDEGKFLASNGSIIGYQEKEDQKLSGTYYELGVELYSPKGGALRLLGRQSRQESDRFETLGNRHINLATTSAALQYMHVF
ncbi:MAG TPA: hypothetical protein VNJ08_07865 [Bacteriovoracaceae bacterium]|nr:hypothetical protein [Bacteriovoracaceae bacterium]